MDRGEYERRRRALEAQRLADLELIEAGYLAKVRSLEALWAAAQETGEPEGRPAALPASAPKAAPAAAPAAAEAPVRRHNRSWAVFDAIVDALPGLPEEFDTRELVRALGQRPSRTTFYRAVEELIREGRLEIAAPGFGSRTTRYRKRAAG